jgi:hypothetical protein
MAWNAGNSILGTGNSKQDVEREDDVIVVAAFIGMTLWQNQKNEGLVCRVDMEPNTEASKTRPERTAYDRNP